MKIKHEPDELKAMLNDLSLYKGILGPGPYWIHNQKSTIDWLLNNDLNFFFQYDRINKSLSNFGGGSRWRSATEIEKEIQNLNKNKIFYLLQKFRIRPLVDLYKIKLRDLSREKYIQKLLGHYLILFYKSRDIENELTNISSSGIGNPSDTLDINGNIYTSKFLDEFLKYLEIKKHVDFASIENFLEIGPGVGTFSEVIAKLFPKLKLYLVDIPPQLYLTQQYLSSVFPNQVASYEEIKKNPKILNSAEYRIFILAPWQVDLLKFDKLDFAFNQVSFSEMKKETVGSYLSYLSQWNTQIVNIRAVDKNKTKEGPSFKDYVDNLPDYELIDKKQISADFKEKLGETRTSSALYFKKK